MKKLAFLPLILFAQILFAQDINQCRSIVELTIESIKNKSSEKLDAYLAEDFTMGGQKGEVAKMILHQLFTQLNDNVTSFKETNQHKIEEDLKLEYNIEYENRGTREAIFVFNNQNLLKELHLFKMEVKSMSSESKIDKNTKEMVEIPFEMVGNLIAVDVLLNGTKRKFILDSGSPKVILNSAHLPVKDSSRLVMSTAKGVNGNISGINIHKVDSLDFEGIKLIGQEVISLDLSSIEEGLNCSIYGLIGFELIKDYDILFDYKQQQLTLFSSNAFEKYKQNKLSGKEITTVPFALRKHIPVIEVQIDSKVLNLGIDCGAESNLIDVDLFPFFKRYTSKIEIDHLSGASKVKKEVRSGKLKNMIIANKKFKKLNTVYSDISHFNKSYKLNIDGLIGYPILSKQRTLLSFNRKELVFIE